MSLLHSYHTRVCEGGSCSLSKLPSILTVFLFFPWLTYLLTTLRPLSTSTFRCYVRSLEQVYVTLVPFDVFPVFPKTPGRTHLFYTVYGVQCLWSNCDKRSLDLVSKPQKRAARIILGADSHAPSVHFFNKLKRIPFFANAKLAKFCIIYNRWQVWCPVILQAC